MVQLGNINFINLVSLVLSVKEIEITFFKSISIQHFKQRTFRHANHLLKLTKIIDDTF